MIIPDPYKRTVKIPVKFVSGFPFPFYGGAWPLIKEGTVGDLLLPAYAFEKSADATLLSALLTAPILPKDEELLVGLRIQAHSDDTLQNRSDLRVSAHFESFAKVRLDEELRLTLRGTKKASLDPCRCWIPALNRTAKSLNEAYSLLSFRYEPKRRSHAGNVFRHIFFCFHGKSGETRWERLDLKRERMEWKLAARFQKTDNPT